MAHHPTIQAPIPASTEQVSASQQAGGILIVLILTWIAGLAGWLATRRRFWLAPIAASTALTVALLHIFRNPKRTIVPSQHAVLSPSDGLVRSVTMVREQRFLRGPAMQIDLKVTPGNVQVTRAPFGGVVRLRRYEPGQAIEHADDATWLGIAGPTGTRVVVCQVASPFWRRMPSHWARRMLCWPEVEDSVQAGEVIGHLTLGGTVRVFVPATGSIRVRSGQRVIAGETILAVMPSTSLRLDLTPGSGGSAETNDRLQGGAKL